MAAKKIGAKTAAARKTRPAKAKKSAPKTAKVAQTKPAAKKAEAAVQKSGVKKAQTKKIQIKKAQVKKIAVKKAAATTSPSKQAAKKAPRKTVAPPPGPAAKAPAATPMRKAPAKPVGRVPIRPPVMPTRVAPGRKAAAKAPPVSTRVETEKAANPIKRDARAPAHLPLARVVKPSRSPARSPARLSRAAKAAAKDAKSAQATDAICSEAALRERIDKALTYLEAWVCAAGQVPLDNREAVAAEAARAQIWQWLTLEAICEDGQPLTTDRFKILVDEEKSRLEAMSEAATRFDAARTLLLDLSSAQTYPDFPSPMALGFIESS